MPVVINGHHRLRAKDNNIFLQLPERKIALQGMLNRARASYQQEGEAMHNNIFLQLDNKARECKATVFPVGHTHNDIDQIFSGKGSRTYMYKHRRCAICEKYTRNKKCGRCLEAYYCGRQCQKLDWREHKLCCVSCVEMEIVD